MLKITQVKSRINRKRDHKATLDALGINRIGQTVYQEDTPAVRGMVHKVAYMLEVELVEFPAKAAPKRRIVVLDEVEAQPAIAAKAAATAAEPAAKPVTPAKPAAKPATAAKSATATKATAAKTTATKARPAAKTGTLKKAPPAAKPAAADEPARARTKTETVAKPKTAAIPKAKSKDKE
jgi:large subunit ribosomal protein L30